MRDAHPSPELVQLGFRQRCQILAFDLHDPGRRVDQPDDVIHRDGLSRPRRADQDRDGAPWNDEAGSIQRPLGAELLDDLHELDRGV